jgi:hypothetical protein
MAGDVNGWWTAIDLLPEIIARIRRVEILCRPALEAIPKFDHEDALVYCDPPYVHATREKNSRDVYHGEMSDGDHVRLAGVLNRCQSKVVVSGYPSVQNSHDADVAACHGVDSMDGGTNPPPDFLPARRQTRCAPSAGARSKQPSSFG